MNSFPSISNLYPIKLISLSTLINFRSKEAFPMFTNMDIGEKEVIVTLYGPIEVNTSKDSLLT